MTAAVVATDTEPLRAVRNTVLALGLILTAATSIVSPAAARVPAPSPSPRITGVVVIVTVRPGVTRDNVIATMPAEVRQTVQLYLDGKVREWYSRGDGRGVVFLLNAKNVAEARATMAELPLSRQNLVDDDFIPVGPLLPLRLLMATPARPQ